jgi:nucleotide-binding universal stress UspA family protein
MSQLYMQKMIDSTKQAAETYSGKLGKIQVKSDILFGNPAEEIIKCADKEDISLIIMSTHGQSGIRRWTLGSVANKVDFCSTEEVAALQGTAMVNSIREGKS